jgi:predicted ATPase
MAISLYNREHHRPLAFRYGGRDPGVDCLSHAACTLWQLGYPDQALKRVNEALALAQWLSHPYSLAFAQFFGGILRQYRREARAAQENAESGITLSTEHGFTQFLAYVIVLRGWAMVKQRRNEEGIVQIREGLAASRATGAELLRPYHLCLLAEACMGTGRPDEGRAMLAEIYGWFTEGFDTADLKEAKSLIAELST